jgi:hypothetical protein
MRRATRTNGTEYYEFIFVLVLSTNPKVIIMCLDQNYVLKPWSIGKPTQYVGSEVGDYTLPDDPTKTRWHSSHEKNSKEAIRNVTNWMSERVKTMRAKVQTPLSSGYRPELDATPYSNEEESDYYQQQIGVLQWTVEFGRINITAAVSILASYTAALRHDQLPALFHLFSYLKGYDRSNIVFDDCYVDIQDEENYNWTGFYSVMTEKIPTNVPKERGKPMQMTVC